jgi:LmbE family N-acetylglucosaminyl deacetylase
MIRLSPSRDGRPLDQILCLGAHCDDIEIGCSGTLLDLIGRHPEASVTWVVMGSTEVRAQEALESAHALLSSARKKNIVIKSFRDGFFPYVGGEIKACFEELKREVSPDLVFTHYRHDLHQDHRLMAELTWNTFRDHLILEYEIPKYDGDLGSPNVFVPLDEAVCQRKIENILGTFRSQADKPWFTEDLFRAILRIRGMESHAPSGFAEAFHCRKAVLSWEQDPERQPGARR